MVVLGPRLSGTLKEGATTNGDGSRLSLGNGAHEGAPLTNAAPMSGGKSLDDKWRGFIIDPPYTKL